MPLLMLAPLLLVLTVLVRCQEPSPSGSPTVLTLNQVYRVSLPASQPLNYSLVLPQHPKEGQSLFIEAASLYNDPFEQPSLTVTADNSFRYVCDEEQGSFTGICQIGAGELRKDRQFVITVSCLVQCEINLAAYMSTLYELGLGKSVEISAMSDFALARYVRIKVPADVVFSEIIVMAELKTYDTATQGFELLANYGSSPAMPTQSSSQKKGASTYGHRLSLQITSKQLQPGQQIVVFVFIGVNNTVELTSFVSSDERVQVEVGAPVVDFTGGGDSKVYFADLSKYSSEGASSIENDEIMVKLIVYSGSPTIKVSFDPDFASTVTNNSWLIESAMAYLLTPKLRKDHNFANRIYVRVESTYSSSYYLEIVINRKQFNLLENSLMQMIKLEPQQYENIIYEDENYIADVPATGIVRYKLKIEMVEGAVQLGIRDCDSLMRSNQVSGCLIRDAKLVSTDPEVKKSFDNIQGVLEKYYNTYELSFEYNVSTCPRTNLGTFQERFLCDFHIYIVNAFRQPVYLGVQIHKYSQQAQLKEGLPVKDTVLRSSTNYYTFQLHSVESVMKLQFYANVLQGDISMLLSRKQPYPDLSKTQSNISDVQVSLDGRLVINADTLTPGVYYVGVYGYEMSDYTVGVALQRAGAGPEGEQVTEIRLTKGISQAYTMDQGKNLMKFAFTTGTAEEKVQVRVTPIQGDVQFRVERRDSPSSTPVCNSQTTQSSNYCQFSSQSTAAYLVTIYGDPSSLQTFSISYSDDSTCQRYPIDSPLYIQLSTVEQDGDFQCFRYTLREIKDIEITIGMSELDDLRVRDVLNVSVDFGAGGRMLQMQGHEHIIGRDQLVALCEGQSKNASAEEGSLNGGGARGCQFDLRVALNPAVKAEASGYEEDIQIMVAVQAFDDENVLFDGIPEKIITQKLSMQQPKHFFYFIYDSDNAQDLTIFLHSQTESRYQLAARVVSLPTFSQDRNQSQYPVYNSNDSDTTTVNSSLFTPITVLNIPKQNLSLFQQGSTVKMSVVLVSVFGFRTAEESKDSLYVFKIEATQKGTSLAYGESKIGYVDKDEIYQYEIEVGSATASVVAVRPNGLDKCLKTYLESRLYNTETNKYEVAVSEFQELKTFTGERGSWKILIKGLSDQTCSYQVTYNSLDTPLITILKSVPYEFDLSPEHNLAYYLHYHKQSEGFKIVQMITAGNSVLYAGKVAQQESVGSLLMRNLDKFPYISEVNGNLAVEKQSAQFCSKCYYLIVVRGKSSSAGQLSVSLESVPVPLREGSLMKDKLKPNSRNRYQFYSISSFNLSLTLIYGPLSITVTTPDNQTLTRNLTSTASVANPLTMVIPASKVAASQQVDYFDSNSRFVVEVSSSSGPGSSYYITVRKKDVYLRLYEGVPMYAEVKAGVDTRVQFSNVDAESSLNVLIEDLEQQSGADLQITVALQSGQAGQDIIKNQTKAQSSYNLELAPHLDDYIITVKSNRSTRVSVILAKVSFTHLIAGRTLFLTRPSIFQIFTPGDPVLIEIFACQNDIDIVASSNYSRLTDEQGQDSSLVRMEHANYGGHYVISAEDIPSGEYYVRTIQADTSAPMSYMIGYTYYTPSAQERNPYKVLALRDANIEHIYRAGMIEFRLSRLYRKDAHSTVANTEYRLYIGNSSDQITAMSRCELGTVYTVREAKEGETVSAGSYRQYVSFTLKIEEIRAIIGESNTYYVGGEASLSWPASSPNSNHVRSAYFVYSISQLVINNQPQFVTVTKTTNFVVLWIVVPFILGSMALFLAGRYFLRSLTAGPTQLIEEEDYGASEGQFVGQDEGKTAGHGTLQQSEKSDIS